MAAKYIDTVATADEKSELTDIVIGLAKKLTEQGMGKTHFVKLEKKRGTWMVSLYQR